VAHHWTLVILWKGDIISHGWPNIDSPLIHHYCLQIISTVFQMEFVRRIKPLKFGPCTKWENLMIQTQLYRFL